MDEEIKKVVYEHINFLNSLNSHYVFKESEKTYLDDLLNIKIMFLMLKEKYPHLIQQFSNFNVMPRCYYYY